MALREHGTRVRRGSLSIVFLDEPGASSTRIAYAIGKRVGGAVQRNRLRRRLRAIFADLAHHEGGVPVGTMLVSAGPELVDRGPRDLRNDVQAALDALATRRAGEVTR